MKTATISCSACKRREAFFHRPYSGQSLCKKCFTESIEAKVRATIAKYNMLEAITDEPAGATDELLAAPVAPEAVA